MSHYHHAHWCSYLHAGLKRTKKNVWIWKKCLYCLWTREFKSRWNACRICLKDLRLWVLLVFVFIECYNLFLYSLNKVDIHWLKPFKQYHELAFYIFVFIQSMLWPLENWLIFHYCHDSNEDSVSYSGAKLIIHNNCKKEWKVTGSKVWEGEELSLCSSWSNSLWQGWSCELVHCPGGNATDPIWRVLASSNGISSWTPLKPQHSIPCWLSVQWEPNGSR